MAPSDDVHRPYPPSWLSVHALAGRPCAMWASGREADHLVAQRVTHEAALVDIPAYGCQDRHLAAVPSVFPVHPFLGASHRPDPVASLASAVCWVAFRQAVVVAAPCAAGLPLLQPLGVVSQQLLVQRRPLHSARPGASAGAAVLAIRHGGPPSRLPDRAVPAVVAASCMPGIQDHRAHSHMAN